MPYPLLDQIGANAFGRSMCNPFSVSLLLPLASKQPECGPTQALQKTVPQDFELMGQRKGFVRYMNPALRALVKQHADAQEAREAALTGILQVTFLPTYSSVATNNHVAELPLVLGSPGETMSLS